VRILASLPVCGGNERTYGVECDQREAWLCAGEVRDLASMLQMQTQAISALTAQLDSVNTQLNRARIKEERRTELGNMQL
jgi:hypothetical protein